jgi:hypothetical protein
MVLNSIRNFLITAVLVLTTAVLADGVWAREPGKGQVEALMHGTPITVYTYQPSSCENPSLLFVFHGLGRKASKIRNNAKTVADNACLIILAPLLDRDRFPNWRYHRAGVVRKGRVQPTDRWTGPIVDALIDWGRRWAGDPEMPYYLFGHSAGGQFLSRISAYSPPVGASRIVVANPSVHVLANLLERAPYGIGGVFSKNGALAHLRAYLALPLTIYLGEQDRGDKNLVINAAASRQGSNRLERGQFAFQLGMKSAEERGWQFNWRLVIASGVGHSSKNMLHAPEMLKALGKKPE